MCEKKQCLLWWEIVNLCKMWQECLPETDWWASRLRVYFMFVSLRLCTSAVCLINVVKHKFTELSGEVWMIFSGSISKRRLPLWKMMSILTSVSFGWREAEEKWEQSITKRVALDQAINTFASVYCSHICTDYITEINCIWCITFNLLFKNQQVCCSFYAFSTRFCPKRLTK